MLGAQLDTVNLECGMPSRRPHPAAAVPPPYHHGDLQPALLQAAEALLDEAGLEAFTLRACARRAGVSHAAPAHHFGDARGLLSALAASGFGRLADQMQVYVDAAPAPDATAHMAAVGQAYIDFALAHRALFQLMFRRDRLDPAHPALCAAGLRTGNALRQAVDALMQQQRLPPASRPTRLLLAWSAVHGYATLVLEQQTAGLFGLDADRPEAARQAGAALLQALMAGLQR